MASFSSFRYPARFGPSNLGPLWTALFYGVPLANVAIHLAWLAALHPIFSSLPVDRRRLSEFLHKYFMLNSSHPRLLTFFTSAFSHIQPLHLFVNMSTYKTYVESFYSLGVSPLRFVALSLGSAIAACLCHILNARRGRGAKKNAERTAVGASGALTGLGTALACMFPTMKVRLSGTNQVLPLRVVVLGMFAVDAYCLSTERDTGVGHAGHLGGAAFGLAYFLWRRATGAFTL
ncbi:rhomboid family protein [Colletotrichum orchidophilum]|uniref:Rhomboid family protein n=1 Tax=Colletotrichum orchidophilum TaxID=1209926 RepID=A0A1G4B1M8_9PEZI|nr:rhomboid family protein [Colletotrichum orchidophilum]OHE95291.1 rhomboid family protein [Colletotrichum orchidophilum]